MEYALERISAAGGCDGSLMSLLLLVTLGERSEDTVSVINTEGRGVRGRGEKTTSTGGHEKCFE